MGFPGRTFSAVTGRGGSFVDIDTGLGRSSDLLVYISESLALKLRSVSFLGVSFLLRDGLVGVVWTLGVRRGSGEKQVNEEVRGGGRLSGQTRIGVSAWQISDNGRDGRSM